MSVPAPFELRSTAWLLTALRLHTAHVPTLVAALDARFADSPGLFDDDALVLDLSPLRDADALVDYPSLIAQLRRHRLLPVAVQGGSVHQMEAARAAGLSLATEPEAAPPPPAPAPAPAWVDTVPVVDQPAEPPPEPTMVVDRPLRSGQRVYARGGDLVVLQAVSVGAEVIADGHIHVYAPLRGRAMAGARGDTAARIFSTCMEAQLVSIAGIYRTTETPLPPAVQGQPAHVRLAGTRLLVEPITS